MRPHCVGWSAVTNESWSCLIRKSPLLRDEQDTKGEMAKQVAQLNDQLRRQQELEEAIHNRIQALEIEHRAPGRISVASRAVAVSEPEKDKRVLLSLMTLAGSLFAGVALAHLRMRHAAAYLRGRRCAADRAGAIPWPASLPRRLPPA